MITDEMAAMYTSLGRQVAEHYENAVCAFVSGSLIEGLGNSRSDLDVFIISSHTAVESPAEAVSLEVGEARVDVTFSGGLRADTEVWDPESVRSAAAELRGIEPGNRIAMMGVPLSRLELAHSVRVGLPVREESKFREVQSGFDYTKLACVQGNRLVSLYQNSAEDAAGAVTDGDSGTALLTSRTSLGCAVDAYLAACGDTNPKPKWRTRKLHRLGEKDMLAEYLACEVQESVDERSLLVAAKRRLRFANQIAQRAQEKLETLA